MAFWDFLFNFSAQNIFFSLILWFSIAYVLWTLIIKLTDWIAGGGTYLEPSFKKDPKAYPRYISGDIAGYYECEYCRSLNPDHKLKCVTCGAPKRRKT